MIVMVDMIVTVKVDVNAKMVIVMGEMMVSEDCDCQGGR